MLVDSPDLFVVVIFVATLVSVVFIILRRASSRSEETTYDSEAVSIPDPGATSGSDEKSDQRETDVEAERPDAHRAPRGRRRKLPFSNTPQPTQFSGEFSNHPSSNCEFGNGFSLSEKPRLDQTSPWALPPEEADDEETESRHSHDSENTEHEGLGSDDGPDRSEPSPYLHSGFDDRTDDEDDEW